MDLAEHSCNMCAFSSAHYADFVKHTVRMHKNDPRFRVYCEFGSCGFTTKKWNSYKVHVSKFHREAVYMLGNTVFDNHMDGGEEDVQEMEQNDASDAEFHTKILFAHYLLKLETCQRLSEIAIDAVSQQTQFLLQESLSKQRQVFCQWLRNANIDFDIEEFNDVTLNVDLSDLCSKYRRNRFYVQHCNLVQPSEVLLGTRIKNVRGRVNRLRDYGYIVPLKETLTSLFRLPEFVHFLYNPHNSVNGYKADLCDGDFIGKHPLFSNDPHALQLILYADDLEIVNPLGTHTRKHKVLMVYFTLANIPPEYRSKLSAIYLLAIAKNFHVKRHGIKKLLKDFVNTVNELSSTGIHFLVEGVQKLVKGSLAIVVADTPAANFLGGFKEGVAFASKPCRTCSISSKEVPYVDNGRQLRLRSLQQHVEMVQLLANPDLPKGERQRWSKELGVNSRSCLLDINGFNICEALPHDPMHVLLEGVVPMEMALLLYYCIEVKRFFSLRWLNSELDSFPYSYLEKKNKPEVILKSHYFQDLKVKQTSAAMLTLCSILPFVVGKKIPINDSKCDLFLILLNITHIVTSPIASDNTRHDLAHLVTMHHRQFRLEYPKASVTPKMHYLLHLGKQIADFGPGRTQWCMRFEAKHAFFTQVKWRNFINLPKSMALRHQKWMCYQMLTTSGEPSTNYLYEGDDVHGGHEVSTDELRPEARVLLQRELPDVNIVYCPDQVTIHGNTYRSGCLLTLSYDDDNFPVYRWLDQICLNGQAKYFLVRNVEVTDVISHINAYQVAVGDQLSLVRYQDLLVKMPLSLHFFNNRPCVCNLYCMQSLKL